MILENGEVVLYRNENEFRRGRDLLFEYGYKFYHGGSLMEAFSQKGMRFVKQSEYPQCIATLGSDMLNNKTDSRIHISSEGWYDIVSLSEMIDRLHRSEIAVEDLL